MLPPARSGDGFTLLVIESPVSGFYTSLPPKARWERTRPPDGAAVPERTANSTSFASVDITARAFRVSSSGMRKVIELGVTLLLVTAGAGAEGGPATAGRHVRASLVAEADAAQPGRSLLVGFRLEMEPGWHTYWRNPGDSGLPTKVRWELPEGFSAGELQWPRPIRFATGPLVSYGYEHEVLHPVRRRS
jgi:hypothetical protein